MLLRAGLNGRVNKKPQKIRGGHREYLTKVLAQAKELVNDFNEESRSNTIQLRESIKETIGTIKKLDDGIIELVADDKDSSEAEVTKEIEDTAKLRVDAKKKR